MITRPTVLILGAGASVDYGFPTGLGLLSDVCQNLRLATYLEQEMMIPKARVSKFQRELKLSNAPSVDLFLEHRRDFEDIGKPAIAVSLIPHEMVDKFADDKGWYRKLFGLMIDGGRFEENQLSVLTFNYDRSLEAFFFYTLINFYGLDAAAAQTRLRQIPIIHLYGSLGNLLWKDPKRRERAYQPELTPEWVQDAADSIKIMHEVKPGEEFEKAKKLLRDAEEVIFLGFGFHAINVQRLDLEKAVVWHRKIHGRHVQWFACRTGMGEGDVARAKASLKLPGVSWGFPSPNIVEFLKNTPCLIP